MNCLGLCESLRFYHNVQAIVHVHVCLQGVYLHVLLVNIAFIQHNNQASINQYNIKEYTNFLDKNLQKVKSKVYRYMYVIQYTQSSKGIFMYCIMRHVLYVQ